MFSPFILLTMISYSVLSSDKKYEDPGVSLDHFNAVRLIDLNASEAEYNYRCVPCNLTSARYYDFVRHRHNGKCVYRPKNHIDISDSLKFVCGFCGFECNTHKEIGQHQSNIKNLKQRIDGMSEDQIKAFEANALKALELVKKSMK